MTKERYAPGNENTGSIISDLKLLMKNSQWRIVFLFNILLLTAVVTRGSATMYYIKYVLLRPDLIFTFIVTGMIAALSGALPDRACCQRSVQLAGTGQARRQAPSADSRPASGRG